MNSNKEILNFVNSNLKLEGMALSASEKQTIMQCLSNKTSFDNEIKKIITHYKKATA